MISINTLVEKIHKLLENTELDNLNNLSSNVKSRLFMVDYS